MITEIFRMLSAAAIADIRNPRVSKVMSRLSRTAGEGDFIVRVDDFPRGDRRFSEYEQFHRIMVQHNVPYILGVTPFETYFTGSGEFSERMGFLVEHNIRFGLHGLTHQPGELRRIGLTAAASMISDVVPVLKQLAGFLPVYIPPFNDIFWPEYVMLSRYFNAVTGGPESIKTMGLFPPCKLKGTWYLPSYWGFYGRSADILGFLDSGMAGKTRRPMPITLHWAWEADDDFRDLRRLLSRLRGRVSDWGAYNDSNRSVRR